MERYSADTSVGAITQEFWSAGRLTLEWWLVPRLREDVVHPRPETSVAEVATNGSGPARVTLSNGEDLTVDKIVFATGYRADLGKVPYLSPMASAIDVADGFPALDEGMQTSVPGLYMPGFPSTKDFGPFFGFTRGCPVAASIIVEDLLARR